jgi:hypothetical protein
MSSENELGDIIVKKDEIVYKELDERGIRESSARDISLESYVYAYMKEIHSLYNYVIDTHLHDKKMGSRLDNLDRECNICTC